MVDPSLSAAGAQPGCLLTAALRSLRPLTGHLALVHSDQHLLARHFRGVEHAVEQGHTTLPRLEMPGDGGQGEVLRGALERSALGHWVSREATNDFLFGFGAHVLGNVVH